MCSTQLPFAMPLRMHLMQVWVQWVTWQVIGSMQRLEHAADHTLPPVSFRCFASCSFVLQKRATVPSDSDTSTCVQVFSSGFGRKR